MKVTEEVFELMKKDIKVILNYYFPNKDKSFEDFIISDFYDIWYVVYVNRRYSDNHPSVNFVNGKRLLEYDSDFDYYPCDTNDNTLLTTIKTAVKLILNEVK